MYIYIYIYIYIYYRKSVHEYHSSGHNLEAIRNPVRAVPGALPGDCRRTNVDLEPSRRTRLAARLLRNALVITYYVMHCYVAIRVQCTIRVRVIQRCSSSDYHTSLNTYTIYTINTLSLILARNHYIANISGHYFRKYWEWDTPFTLY